MTFEIKRPEIAVLLLFLTLIFVMELQVTFNTPISFGDEAFHTRMAQWIAQNVEYPVWVPFTQTLISRASFERQPFWNILEAGFFYVLGFNEGVVKLLVPMIAMLTGIAVYLFGTKFYNWRIGFIAAVILVTAPSFVTYSVLFYTDALITFFLVMFLYMFSLSVKTGRRLHMMTAGAFAALAFMTKLTGYIVYAFVALIFLYYFIKEKKFFFLIKKYSPMFLVMILIPSTFFIRNYRYYNTPICYRLPFISSITDKFINYSGCIEDSFEPQYEYEGRTEEVSTEASVFRMGVMTYLEFAYGNIWFVVFSFFAGVFLIFSKIDKINTILLAMMLLYIPLFFATTYRAEDTSRYALMWLPVISIIAANFFEGLHGIVKKYHRHIALVVFVIVLYFGYLNAAPKAGTMVQVKQFSPSFFEACDWVKENTQEDARLSTVWTHRASYSCQRNVIPNLPDMSLSQDIGHILSTAEKLGITHIFVQKFSLSSQALSEKYPINYVQLLEDNPEQFKKVFENGPSLSQCIQQGACDGNIIYEIVY
jgi:hypothetical protein